jgi:single-strand DNA-binding protein
MNKVQLLGNITRDPELRYTPAGMAVTSFGVATNRIWTTKQGEKKEDVQFHRIVAWNKLAELCAQLLKKGRRVLVEGRLQYREITDQAGVKKQIAEIVIDDMIIMDNKGTGANNQDKVATADYSHDETAHVDAPAEDANANLEDIVLDDLPVDDKKDEMPF